MFARVLVVALVALFVAISSATEETIPILPKAEQNLMDYSAKLNTTQDGWTLYKQCDSTWGSNQLGTCSETICSAGCAMSSVAMMLTTKGTSKNPGQLNSWLKSNGGYSSGCLINWASVNVFGTVTYIGKQHPSETEICNGLPCQ